MHILQRSGKSIASDIIEVDIYVALFNDITWIDLPGIVRSIGNGESSTLIEDIRTLNNTFLRNE
jgi:hypothetical protein